MWALSGNASFHLIIDGDPILPLLYKTLEIRGRNKATLRGASWISVIQKVWTGSIHWSPHWCKELSQDHPHQDLSCHSTPRRPLCYHCYKLLQTTSIHRRVFRLKASSIQESKKQVDPPTVHHGQLKQTDFFSPWIFTCLLSGFCLDFRMSCKEVHCPCQWYCCSILGVLAVGNLKWLQNWLLNRWIRKKHFPTTNPYDGRGVIHTTQQTRLCFGLPFRGGVGHVICGEIGRPLYVRPPKYLSLVEGLWLHSKSKRKMPFQASWPARKKIQRTGTIHPFGRTPALSVMFSHFGHIETESHGFTSRDDLPQRLMDDLFKNTFAGTRSDVACFGMCWDATPPRDSGKCRFNRSSLEFPTKKFQASGWKLFLGKNPKIFGIKSLRIETRTKPWWYIIKVKWHPF